MTTFAPRDSADVVQAVAARMDVDEVIASVLAAISKAVFPERSGDPEFMGPLRACVRGNVRGILQLVSGEAALGETNVDTALAFAEVSARAGVPLSDLEQAYWVGVEQFWEEWFTLASAAYARGAGTMEELLGAPTRALFDYVIHVLDRVVEEYGVNSDAVANSRDERRRALLARVLDGLVTGYDQRHDHALGYRLRAVHIAVMFEIDERDRVDRLVESARASSEAWGSLVVQQGLSTWVAWLGFPGTVPQAAMARLRHALDGAGVPVAVGDPCEGIDGLRRTYEQARITSRLRNSLVQVTPSLWFHEVRLEALLLDNEDAARQFVVDELGILAGDNERAERTRQTLLAWLSTGSQSRAAAILDVHENTVRLRVRQAEEQLGQALTSRRTELLVALRLCQALGAAQMTGPPAAPRPPVPARARLGVVR